MAEVKQDILAHTPKHAKEVKKILPGKPVSEAPQIPAPAFLYPPWGNDRVLSLDPKTFCHPTLKNIWPPHTQKYFATPPPDIVLLSFIQRDCLPPHSYNLFATSTIKNIFASHLPQKSLPPHSQNILPPHPKKCCYSLPPKISMFDILFLWVGTHLM